MKNIIRHSADGLISGQPIQIIEDLVICEQFIREFPFDYRTSVLQLNASKTTLNTTKHNNIRRNSIHVPRPIPRLTGDLRFSAETEKQKRARFQEQQERLFES